MEKESLSFPLLGKRLREARKEKGMTQKELSEGIVTRNMLSRIENGGATPSLAVLAALASRLDLPVGALLDGGEGGDLYRRSRLAEKLREEYRAGNYALCLEYGKALFEGDEEGDFLLADCSYRMGKEELYTGSLPLAKELFHRAAVAAYRKSFTFPHDTDCRMWEAVIAALLAAKDKEDGEDFLAAALEFPPCGEGIQTFAALYFLIRDAGAEAAKAFLARAKFPENAETALAEGYLLYTEGENDAARKRLFSVLPEALPIPLRSLCFSLLEKTSAGLSDFARAYAYAKERSELMKNAFFEKKV